MTHFKRLNTFTIFNVFISIALPFFVVLAWFCKIDEFYDETNAIKIII